MAEPQLPPGWQYVPFPDPANPGQYVYVPQRIQEPSQRGKTPAEMDFEYKKEAREASQAALRLEIQKAEYNFKVASDARDFAAKTRAEERLADLNKAKTEIEQGELSLRTDSALRKYGIDLATLALEQRKQKAQEDLQADTLKFQREKAAQDAKQAQAELDYKRSSGEATLGQRKEEFDYKKHSDDLDRASQTAKFEYEKAINARDYDAANYWKNRGAQLEEARYILDQQRALGYVNGRPTLEREQYESKLANEPGNYFNYAFRSRGEEPPPLPNTEQPPGLSGQPPASGAQPPPQFNLPPSGAAPPVQPGAPQSIDNPSPPLPLPPEPPNNLPATRPWWENYSRERLERFPDEELAKLPHDVLAGFRNEFLLKRPALLALLHPDRVQGTGQWQGTGFAQDVIDKYAQGAPTPKEPANYPEEDRFAKLLPGYRKPTGLPRASLGPGNPIEDRFINSPEFLQRFPDASYGNPQSVIGSHKMFPKLPVDTSRLIVNSPA